MPNDSVLVLDYGSPSRRSNWSAEWWHIIGIAFSLISIATIGFYYRWLTDHFYPRPQYWLAGLGSDDERLLWYGPVLSTAPVTIALVQQFLSRPTRRVQRPSFLVISIVLLLGCWLAIPVAKAAFMLATFPAQQ